MRTRLILLMALLCCAALATADQPMFAPRDPGAARTGDLDDLSGVTDAATARSNLDVYSKTESDELAAQSTLRYYFKEENSDVEGYEAFATAPMLIQASDPITLTTSLALIDAWITPQNTPHLTTLVSGIYEVEGYMSKTGNGTAYTIMELWSRNTEGTETFIASSTTSTLTGVIASPVLGILRFSVTEPVELAATDRLVVKLYGYRGAVTAGLVLWYGGATSAFFGVPISPRNFLRLDGSNAGAAAASNIINAGIGNASFTGRIDFTSSSPTNFTATFTINGEDVLGAISTALDGILGS